MAVPSDGPWANLLAPEALDDPYAMLAALRAEHGPVCWSGRHRAWLLTSFAEVSGGYRDPRLSSDRVEAIVRHLDAGERAGMAPTVELLRGWMVFRDEPDHTRLRDPVRWAFTPKAMDGLKDQVQTLVDALVDEVVEAGTCDLVATFAFPLPAMVIAHLLGVPATDRDKFGTWSRKLAAVVFGAGDDPARRTLATEGSTEFTEYFRWLVAQREADPGDDLVSALVAARGEKGLNADELAGACTLLLFAGHETTADLLANGTVALVRHPGELARLRRDPGLWSMAVEEILRFDAPTKVQVRVVTEGHERSGRVLEAGDMVYLCLASANRDQAEFPDPDRFDVGRDPRQHIAFGLGAHHCLGAPLARLEGRLGLHTLFERCASIEIAGDLTYEALIASRSLTALPVTVTPA
ncbi:MAG: cytochrome P450 [Acidimicrobiia bacterium]